MRAAARRRETEARLRREAGLTQRRGERGGLVVMAVGINPSARAVGVMGRFLTGAARIFRGRSAGGCVEKSESRTVEQYSQRRRKSGDTYLPRRTAGKIEPRERGLRPADGSRETGVRRRELGDTYLWRRQEGDEDGSRGRGRRGNVDLRFEIYELKV